MSILNLTRKVLPKLSKVSAENIKYINNMPEMVLAKAIRDGNKNIVHVGMNECSAVRILPNKINTIYTDALAGCNSVGVVAKGLDGNPIAILSHYTPLPVSRQNQASSIAKQLDVYDYYIDKTVKPKVFYNVRGREVNGQFEPCGNAIMGELRNVFNKFFKNGYEEKVMPYQNAGRPGFFSSANIFQFNPSKTSELKITAVGEKEHFIDLKY